VVGSSAESPPPPEENQRPDNLPPHEASVMQGMEKLHGGSHHHHQQAVSASSSRHLAEEGAARGVLSTSAALALTSAGSSGLEASSQRLQLSPQEYCMVRNMGGDGITAEVMSQTFTEGLDNVDWYLAVHNAYDVDPEELVVQQQGHSMHEEVQTDHVRGRSIYPGRSG
jgi:hypothetical protein